MERASDAVTCSAFQGNIRQNIVNLVLAGREDGSFLVCVDERNPRQMNVYKEGRAGPVVSIQRQTDGALSMSGVRKGTELLSELLNTEGEKYGLTLPVPSNPFLSMQTREMIRPKQRRQRAKANASRN